MLRGSLFTQDFLTEGITEYPEWKSITSEEVEAFKKDLKSIFDKFPTSGNPIEPTTENDLIEPILKMLDWDHYHSKILQNLRYT